MRNCISHFASCANISPLIAQKDWRVESHMMLQEIFISTITFLLIVSGLVNQLVFFSMIGYCYYLGTQLFAALLNLAITCAKPILSLGSCV